MEAILLSGSPAVTLPNGGVHKLDWDEARKLRDNISSMLLATYFPMAKTQVKQINPPAIVESAATEPGEDELYSAAIDVLKRKHRASTADLQRHLRIGYIRASKIMEQLEAKGIVSSERGLVPREILVDLNNLVRAT